MGKPLLLDIKEKSIKEVIYETSGDNTGEATLNKSVADFNYIEIVLIASDNREVVRIDNPNEKTFWRELSYSQGNEYFKVFSKFAINGNKITPVVANCGYYTINYTNNQVLMHLDRTNYIRIQKVIGGKYYKEN